MTGAVAIWVGSLALVCGVAGCAAPPPALGSHVAKVTIDGRETGSPYPVTCSQFGWDWKVETLADTPGFVAMFETGTTPAPKAVQIRNLGGFTGSYWKYTTGDAEFRMLEGDFIITGTAVGYTSEQPNRTSSASFSITTDC